MCYPDDYDKVCRGYAEIITAITEFEPVTLVINPEDVTELSQYINGGLIELLPIAHDDAWLRDNGPTFVIGPQRRIAGINWQFNAWGGKYSPWDLDNGLAGKILTHLDISVFDAPLVMEGGSIHVDGEGTLLTTEECLLNANRNPGLSKKQIEDKLRLYLGIEKIIWLKKGLCGDETDGHIDNLACFAAPGKVILQVCDDPDDDNYALTKENRRILESTSDARGRHLETIEIYQPPPVTHNQRRLTLSYLNFYFVNNGLIVPVFGGAATARDSEAVNVLQAAFPNRRVRTVDGMAIIREGGNVHCMTQQVPQVRD
jgi:agmatine deiminase